MSEVAVKVVLVDTAEPPVYQRIARKALHLHELGLNTCAIATRLGVNDKTVAKAINWTRTCGYCIRAAAS